MDGFIMENPNFQWMIWGENPPFKETPMCMFHTSFFHPFPHIFPEKKKVSRPRHHHSPNPMVPWPHAQPQPVNSLIQGWVMGGRQSGGINFGKMYVYIYSI